MPQKIKTIFKPSIGHKTDAGLDVPISKTILLEPFSSACIELPLSNLNLKRKTCGITFIRSKYAQIGLICQPTIIDAGYTGVCHIWVYNVSKSYIKLEAGIAYIQIVCFKVKEWKKVAGMRIKPKSSEKRTKYRDTTR